MVELEFFDEPGDNPGMLDAQRRRTSRVIVDIGFRPGFKAPLHLGGGISDRVKAWEFLTRM